jgi:diguanylate cyclase (GGDEF)-like protein
MANERLHQPLAISNPSDEIQLLFMKNRKRNYKKVLERLGISRDAVIFRLPIMFEENILGILWLWSKNVTKVDLPIISLFAKQVGISLERARLFQEVQSLALVDPLTGLHNRRSLFELGRIEFSRAHRMNREFSCMMLDLDHFKQVNDTYGHQTGDLVLQEFANHCKKSVREVDLVGRYGGEEIIILLPETDIKTAQFVAERLRKSLEKKDFTISNHEIKVTVSIGVAGKDDYTPHLETLIARSDQALYIAKHKGRNCMAVSV